MEALREPGDRAEPRSTPSTRALRALGRISFALPMIAFGVLHFVLGDLTSRFAPGWPPAVVAGRPAAAYVLGIVLIAAGLAILFEKRTRTVALGLAAVIGLSILFLYVPKVAARPGFGGAWTGPAKYLALLGGALLVAELFRENADSSPSPDPPEAIPTDAARLAPRLFLSLFLILGGIQHFVYESFVVTMIPGWIPDHAFWARFAGVALLAGGIGLLFPRTARLAGTMTGLMIFLWFLILHIPRAASAPGDPLEWSGVFESLAVSGTALLVASISPPFPLRPAPRFLR